MYLVFIVLSMKQQVQGFCERIMPSSKAIHHMLETAVDAVQCAWDRVLAMFEESPCESVYAI